jgi:hypothetical protein
MAKGRCPPPRPGERHGTRRRSVLTVEPLESEQPTLAVVEAKREREDGRSDRDPAGAGAATNLDGLQRALLDAALSATTTRWATVACGDCGARSRVELPVPDVRSPAHEPGSERSGRSSPAAARRQPRARDRMRSPPPPGSRRSRERPSEHRWRRPRCECPRPCACCASGNSHHGECTSPPQAARGAVWVCLVPYHQGREPGWTWLERKGRSPPWE